MKSAILASIAVATLLLSVACTSNSTDKVSYKDSVKKALEQAELTDVTVFFSLSSATLTSVSSACSSAFLTLSL